MKRWFRRVVVFLLLLVWLLVMAFPVVAVVLATQKQIEVGGDEGRQVRVFLVQEREQEGVGIEWTRPVAGPGAGQEAEGGCRETRLVYLMWVGEGENVTYCRCFAEDGSLQESYVGSCGVP